MDRTTRDAMRARGDFSLGGALSFLALSMKCSINVACVYVTLGIKKERKNQCDGYICQKVRDASSVFGRAKHQKAYLGKYDRYVGWTRELAQCEARATNTIDNYRYI